MEHPPAARPTNSRANLLAKRQVCTTNIVQPAFNKVTIPLLTNVVIPIVNTVVVPIVNNVIIPYAKTYYNGLVATYNALNYGGNQLWNGYKSFLQADNNFRQWMSHS